MQKAILDNPVVSWERPRRGRIALAIAITMTAFALVLWVEAFRIGWLWIAENQAVYLFGIWAVESAGIVFGWSLLVLGGISVIGTLWGFFHWFRIGQIFRCICNNHGILWFYDGVARVQRELPWAQVHGFRQQAGMEGYEIKVLAGVNPDKARWRYVWLMDYQKSADEDGGPSQKLTRIWNYYRSRLNEKD